MKLPALLLLCLSAPLVFGQTFVTGQAARAEIGQYSFSRGDAYATQQVLGAVGGLAWANGTLYVADDNRVGATPNNNRVMMFNTAQIPGPHDDLSSITPFNTFCALCGYPAYNVIGQTVYTPPPPAADGTQTPPLAGRTATQVSNPAAVASDGTIVAIADTDNNRVLIYNTVPASPGAAANIVLGQPDFTTLQTPGTTASSVRGPQGVWIAGGKLFVADTSNSRILIWNHIPTANNQPADIVLGQPNFTTANQPAAGNTTPTAAANQLLNPTSVTTDPSGTHLFVSDLGFNRVLIWNEIPTSNDQPADVVVGQPDMTSTLANNTNNLCSSPGNDSTGAAIYPSECNKTLNFPRFALSDGTRLYIADGGNDRVLVFNSIPTQNATGADAVLGQPDFYGDVVASGMATFGSTAVDNTGSVDTVQDPTSLAWDGTNLYVSDPYDLRVLVFTPIGTGDSTLPNKAVLNAASRIIRQEGFVELSSVTGGTITAGDTVTITLAGTAYPYTETSSDTLSSITTGIINVINSSNSNAGDPNAFARTGAIPNTVYLTAKNPEAGTDATSLSATTSNTNNLAATASASYLTGGTSATVAPGTLIEIDGVNLADSTQNANTTSTLPTSLGGVQVYIDGFLAPVMSVSPNQVISQVPFTFTDRSSSSLYVRTQHNNGQVGVTNAAPLVIVPANPGLFAEAGNEPRPAFQAMHSATYPSDVVSVDGSVQAGDVATITVGSTAYTYTVLASDSLASIAQGLIAKMASDQQVTASFGGAFARVVLTAKKPGADGNGITVTTSVTAATGQTSAGVTLTAYNPTTCCTNSGSGPVTGANPAAPGEIVNFMATGLGVVQDSSGNLIDSAVAGQPYTGPVPNSAIDPVSATVNSATGQVISAGLPSNSTGVYQVQIQLPSGMGTDPNAQVSIAQDAFVSNIVTIPVSNTQGAMFATPNPVPSSSSTTTVYWNVPSISSNVQIHSGSPTGPVIASGGGTGTATVNNVTDGEVLYLTDAASGSVISAVTLHVAPASSGVTLFANPSTILVPVGSSYGRTTISWNVSATTGQQLHVNSRTGPVVGASISGPGAVTTGNWVNDGMTFYLTDTATGAQIGQPLPVRVQSVSGIITASPNPAPIAPGTPYGKTTITWTAPSASATEIHIGSAGGPLFAAGTGTGTATTGAWLTDGTIFYLQDATNGNSTSPKNTLGTLTIHLGGTIPSTITLPNPIAAAPGSLYGQAAVSWGTSAAATVEIHVGSPTGPIFAAGASTGSKITGPWISNGTTFYLLDASTHATLASTTAVVQ